MDKVKIFRESDSDTLQSKINSWLSDRSNYENIIAIIYNTTVRCHSALIHYKLT